MRAFAFADDLAHRLGLNQRVHWQSLGKRGRDTQLLFEVTTLEHMMVEDMFGRTMPGIVVDKIQRVENGDLHECFGVRRRQCPVALRVLFHGAGSEEANKSIMENGFQPTLSGTRVGQIYGAGTYFARDASYSHSYASALPSGQRQMFAAEVVVGRSTRGAKDMRQCPPLPDEQGRRYDSLVDCEKDPSIFVVQHSNQAYPAFLITYH